MNSLFSLIFLFIFSVSEYSAFRLKNMNSNKRQRGDMNLSLQTKVLKSPGDAGLDWNNLGFEFRPTNSHIQATYKNGVWGLLEKVTEPYIKLHIGATSLHYGQACFEGLKAFQCKDGKVRMFRPYENARRSEESCTRICIPPVPRELFVEACKTVIKDNIEFVPPYGSGGSLYLRPLVIGSGPRIGLQPSDEYTFVVLAIPAGDYYKGGVKAVKAVVVEDYDRAAPRGVGHVKVAGNYAADILPNILAKKSGYPIALYLDAKTNSLIEEFSTSNFLAIDSNNNYVTPKSGAILSSITNKSLMELSRDSGIVVQERPIHIEEVSQFKEVAACGTAVVITPVSSITYKDKVFLTNSGSEGIGPVLSQLYQRVRSIQTGDEVDKLNWMVDL